MIDSAVWIILFQVDISCFVNKIILVQEVCEDLLIKPLCAQEPRVGIVIYVVSKSALLPKISTLMGSTISNTIRAEVRWHGWYTWKPQGGEAFRT